VSRARVLTTVVCVVALALAGCHTHREPNAPGIIDPLVPPRDVTDPQLELPDDPGERMVMLTGGVVGGAHGGSIEDGAAIDLALEATVSWGESESSHNDHASRLFVPRGVIIPPRSTGVTLGWSGLRIVHHDDDSWSTRTGPLYLQAQRAWAIAGVAAGLAFDPSTGGTGPQVDAYFTFYYLRVRILFGDGWELGGGLQIKIPQTWVWSR
jgi:hypothetical protein